MMLNEGKWVKGMLWFGYFIEAANANQNLFAHMVA